MRTDRRAVEREEIRAELEEARAEFRRIRRSFSEEDWRARSLNAGWTNGEIMFHATLGFIVVSRLAPMVRLWSRLPAGFSRVFADVLNFLTPAFNVVNAFGARGGARFYSRRRIARRYNRALASVEDLLKSLPDDEWSAGMYFPTRWDGLFSEYMTMSELLRYPVSHLRFHLGQLSRPAATV